MRWFAATVFAALLAATVPGAAWAETEVVLENESSDTEVNTGDSSFSNTDDTSVSSGTQVEQGDRESFTTSSQNTGAAVQGQAEAVAPAAATQSSTPVATQSLSSAPRSSADLVLADAGQHVSDSFDALFVGLPISSGSISS
ncbi:MAG: hypothetical protein ACRDKJ_06070 [Actinomycetota bacterium]